MFWKWGKRILLGLFVLGAAAWIGLQVFAVMKHRSVMAVWEKEFGPLAKIPEKYPPVQMNESAKRLQSLVLELGIALQPDPGAQVPIVPEKARQGWADAKESLGEYVKDQSFKDTIGLDPMPENVSDYLSSHNATIEAIIDSLLLKEAPQWPFDLQAEVVADVKRTEYTLATEMPSGTDQTDRFAMGIIGIQRIMAAEGLRKMRIGDGAGVKRTMQALAVFNRGFVGRPVAIEGILYLSAWKMAAGSFRQCPAVNSIDDLFPERMLIRNKGCEMFQIEVWMTLEAGKRIRYSRAMSWFDRIGALLMFKANDLYIDFYIRRMGSLALLMKDQEICAFDKAKWEQGMYQTRNPFNVIATISTPNLLGIIIRAFEAELAVEFTGLIQRYKGMPEWPTAPVEEPVQACAAAQWLITPQPDGSLLLAIDREPPWYAVKEGPQPKLPLHFTLGSRNK